MKAVVEGCLRDARTTSDGFSGEFRFPKDLDVFAGHFPNVPLVPGVFLVEAVRCAAERALERPLRLVRVTDAKFTAEVAPDVEVTVEAELDGEKCRATVRTPDAVAASIRLVLS